MNSLKKLAARVRELERVANSEPSDHVLMALASARFALLADIDAMPEEAPCEHVYSTEGDAIAAGQAERKWKQAAEANLAVAEKAAAAADATANQRDAAELAARDFAGTLKVIVDSEHESGGVPANMLRSIARAALMRHAAYGKVKP